MKEYMINRHMVRDLCWVLVIMKPFDVCSFLSLLQVQLKSDDIKRLSSVLVTSMVGDVAHEYMDVKLPHGHTIRYILNQLTCLCILASLGGTNHLFAAHHLFQVLTNIRRDYIHLMVLTCNVDYIPCDHLPYYNQMYMVYNGTLSKKEYLLLCHITKVFAYVGPEFELVQSIVPPRFKDVWLEKVFQFRSDVLGPIKRTIYKNHCKPLVNTDNEAWFMAVTKPLPQGHIVGYYTIGTTVNLPTKGENAMIQNHQFLLSLTPTSICTTDVDETALRKLKESRSVYSTMMCQEAHVRRLERILHEFIGDTVTLDMTHMEEYNTSLMLDTYPSMIHPRQLLDYDIPAENISTDLDAESKEVEVTTTPSSKPEQEETDKQQTGDVTNEIDAAKNAAMEDTQPETVPTMKSKVVTQPSKPIHSDCYPLPKWIGRAFEIGTCYVTAGETRVVTGRTQQITFCAFKASSVCVFPQFFDRDGFTASAIEVSDFKGIEGKRKYTHWTQSVMECAQFGDFSSLQPDINNEAVSVMVTSAIIMSLCSANIFKGKEHCRGASWLHQSAN